MTLLAVSRSNSKPITYLTPNATPAATNIKNTGSTLLTAKLTQALGFTVRRVASNNSNPICFNKPVLPSGQPC